MRLIRAFAAALTTLALILGVPVLLLRLVGNPLTALGGLWFGDVTDQAVLSVLTVIACAAAVVAWVQFTVAFGVELVSGVRRSPVPARIPFVFHTQQRLARALVTAVLLLGPTVLTTVGPTLTATAALPTNPPVSASTSAPISGWAARSSLTGYDIGATSTLARSVLDLNDPPAGAVATVPTRSVVIASTGPRTWWDLAEEHLGSGDQWHTVWDLNQGHTQPDGTVLTNPTTVLRTGWDITIPDNGHTITDVGVTNAPKGVTTKSFPVETVTVEPGDSLSKIGAAHRDIDWTVLWDLNQNRPEPDGHQFTDPDLIRPGWVIAVPTQTPAAEATGGARTVTVRAGDTLSEIAADHGTTTDILWATNQNTIQPGGRIFTNPDHIEPGWTLTLPEQDTQPTQTTPTAAEADPTPTPSSPTTATADSPQADPEADDSVDTQARAAFSEEAAPEARQPDAAAQSAIDEAAGSDEADDEPGSADELPAPSAQAATPENSTTTTNAANSTETSPASPVDASSRGAVAPAQPPAADPTAAADPASTASIEIAPSADTAQKTDTTAAGPAAPVPPVAPTPTSTSAAASTTSAPSTTQPPSTTAADAGATTIAGAAADSGVENADVAKSSAVVSMLAVGGGAVVLTALGLAALIRARRRQFRVRRPGRATPATPAGAADMERLLNSAGERGFADVTWLDQALRSLVHTLAADPDASLPDVIAVRVGNDDVTLVLATPSTQPPAPWTPDGNGSRWTVTRSDPLPYEEAERDAFMPPFPLLVSVGYSPDGDHWLLDLERIRTVRLTGEPQRCANLARYLAAETAMNTWSELLQVTTIGFGHELAGLNPGQLTATTDLPAVTAVVHAHLTSVHHVIASTGADVSSGRLHNIAGDTWAPHLILIDADTQPDTDISPLLRELSPGRQPVAVVITGGTEPNPATSWTLEVDELGILTIPELSLRLIAEQLPADEAAPLAQLLTAAAVDTDKPMPEPADNGDTGRGWEGLADMAGNIRPRLTAAAGQPASKVAGTWPARANSILPLSPAVYADVAATTEEDVVALAPGVTDDIRNQVAAADPDLDADLRAWWDPDTARVKLRLLGPVDVWAAGLDPAPVGKPQKVEAVAYLATRDRGASAAQTRADLWPEDRSDKPTSKVRNLMLGCRNWLGVNPATGREHLPPNAGEDRGGLYTVEGVLTDVDLFRRLRLRALTRGPDGITDLRSALDLVTGMPFEGHRPRGYSWNTELVSHYIGMIADTAHIVATHHLANNEPEPAATAAQVALKAGSTADNVLLDLVAACHARGDHQGGDTYVQRIMTNWGADVEEDIPARTYDILLRRGWLPRRTA